MCRHILFESLRTLLDWIHKGTRQKQRHGHHERCHTIDCCVIPCLQSKKDSCKAECGNEENDAYRKTHCLRIRKASSHRIEHSKQECRNGSFPQADCFAGACLRYLFIMSSQLHTTDEQSCIQEAKRQGNPIGRELIQKRQLGKNLGKAKEAIPEKRCIGHQERKRDAITLSDQTILDGKDSAQRSQGQVRCRLAYIGEGS